MSNSNDRNGEHQNLIHIIGVRRNWKIRPSWLFFGSATIIVLLIVLTTANVFQFLYHQYATSVIEEELSQKQASEEKMQLQWQESEENQKQLRKQLATLQEDLRTTKILLDNARNASQVLTVATTSNSATIEANLSEEETNNPNYEQEIKDLQKQLDTRNKEIAQLKDTLKKQPDTSKLQKSIRDKDQSIRRLQNQLNESENQVRQLSQRLVTMQQEISNPPSEAPTNNASNEEAPLVIEQFQTTLAQQKLFVQFNLKNVATEAQSGHVIITPLSSQDVDNEISFSSRNALPFFIKRFRPFSQEYDVVSQQVAVIRITVWDRNRNKQLDENFPVQ